MEKATNPQEKPPVQETSPKPSLISKLCEVGAAIGWIEKTGRNEFHKYNYATEASIVSKLRGELFSRKVFIFPHIIRNERVEIEVTTEKWSDAEKRKVPSIRKTALTNVDIEWTFIDGESGEKWTIMVPGVGEDSVDKGLYKAFTGSEKYMLMKSFLLPTGDDPERDSKEEADDAVASGREAAAAVGKDKIAKLRNKLGTKANLPVPTLFYAQQPSGLYAISGADDLLRALYHQFKKAWYQQDHCYMVDEDTLEQVKFQCESSTPPIPFSVLKGAAQ